MRGQERSGCHQIALPVAECLNLPGEDVQTGPGKPLLIKHKSGEGF